MRLHQGQTNSLALATRPESIPISKWPDAHVYLGTKDGKIEFCYVGISNDPDKRQSQQWLKYEKYFIISPITKKLPRNLSRAIEQRFIALLKFR